MTQSLHQRIKRLRELDAKAIKQNPFLAMSGTKDALSEAVSIINELEEKLRVAREALLKIAQGASGSAGLNESIVETCIRDLVASKDLASKALAQTSMEDGI